MTEREKLIKLIETGTNLASKKAVEETARIVKENHHYNSATDKTVSISEMLADYLLENGVIILPCSIGDTVYYHKTLCDGKYTVVIEEDTVKRFLINRIETLAIISFNHALSCDDFGKTVFMTREEAEKALEERKSGNETR